MTFPLSKTLDPADFDLLAEELAVVDQHFTKAREQHPLRRWEYAMAVRALDVWLETRRGIGTAGQVVDVGGAGSPFHYMIGNSAIVVDPEEGQTLAEYLETAPRLSQAVFCLSVLEHVDDLDQFLYHLSCLVAPGGLLFLTMDYWDQPVETPDTAHFHWMRKRIFTEVDLYQIRLRLRDFRLLGDWDGAYHGPQVYDYTFASLALVKRR